MNTNEECPVCGEGTLIPMTETTYIGESPFSGDHNIKVSLEYSVCDVCQSEVTVPEQINNNAKAVRQARAEYLTRQTE